MNHFLNRALLGPIFFYFTISFFFTLQAGDCLPGATPFADKRGLKVSSIETRGQLEAREAENIYHAFLHYFDERKDPSRWFHVEGLKEIHKAMFGEVWEWAGTYYDGPPRNIGITPSLSPSELRAFCDQVLGWREGKSSLNSVEQSVRIVHGLVRIHPFFNGNGRFARFVGNLYLFSLESRVIDWPERALQNRTDLRLEYVQALRRADKGDYDELEGLFLRYGGKETEDRSRNVKEDKEDKERREEKTL